MNVATAQAVWCQWPLAERLQLISRWQAQQSSELRACLSLLPEQASTAADKVVSQLPDGRSQIAAYGPCGVVELVHTRDFDMALGLAHLTWACAMGNAVCYQPERVEACAAVDDLQTLLLAADPALALLLPQRADEQQPLLTRRLTVETLHIVVAPSADLPLLIKDAKRASSGAGLVLWVNHALHYEVQRRLPKARTIEEMENSRRSVQVGEIYIAACGSVAKSLQQLHAQTVGRTALYSGDWNEVEATCSAATAAGVSFAVNTAEKLPLGLLQARALYQRPSLTVVSYARS